LDLLQELTLWWQGLDPQMKSTAVGSATSLVVATAGVIAVVWQIGKQARLAIEQNRQNETLKLKLQIYEEISETCQDEGRAEVDFSAIIGQFDSELLLCQFAMKEGRSYSIPRARVPQLIDAHQETAKQAIQIITLTERWHIIDPRVDVFRLAVNAALHDIYLAFGPYYDVALKTMPMEALSGPLLGKLLPWQPPDEATTLQIRQAGAKLRDAILGLGNYVYDFQVEMQNALLGDLFRTRVPPRTPLDPRLVVVRLSEHEKLKAYFNNETAWGREGAQTAERVIRQLAAATERVGVL
jgi:hypothetical protein